MTDETSRRTRKTVVQRLCAPPDSVFPLLCPVREYEWIEPWRCVLLNSDSGVAEKNCVFTTRAPEEPSDDVWVITRHEPNAAIEFVRVNAQRVMCLSVLLTDNGDGTTQAVNEQLLVGLSEAGNQALDALAERFAFEMRVGEAMLNHYLSTGRRLSLEAAVAAASTRP